MGVKIGRRRRAALIRDLFDAEQDVVGLAGKHGLSPDELARWAGRGENRAALSGLCTLADLQTQLLLSRYRLVAATRLIRLATQEEEGTSGEVARKACVDLLKMDLQPAEAGGADEAEAALDEAGLRAALYGEGEG